MQVVANIPFNISTDVVKQVLPMGDIFSEVVLLLQVNITFLTLEDFIIVVFIHIIVGSFNPLLFCFLEWNLNNFINVGRDNQSRDQCQPVQSARSVKIRWEVFRSIERSLITEPPFKFFP